MQLTEIASGLRFPEGPIAFPDGSIVLVEIERGTLTRITAAGKIEVIADLGGGPNGAALGPDGKIYVCNNGGFEWHDAGGILMPGEQPADYSGGRIEQVDPDTGAVRVLYRSCNGVPLRGPNDLVFDRHGGFYFTDHGKIRHRERDRTGVFYARTDGSMIKEIVFPLEAPNGVGLSPDEDTLYVAETFTGRLWAFPLAAPGEIKRAEGPTGGIFPGRLVAGLPGLQLFDSLAVDGEGNICVATLVNGGITSISPDGQKITHYAAPDILTTNICFGGSDMTTAYLTLSSTGKLVRAQWPVAGLKLNFLNK
jgi:gluconolactonase